jgi:hypothetical protein
MIVLATSSETWILVGLAIGCVLLLIVPAVAFAWLVIERCIGDPAGYDRAVADVQRFIDLTERSRAQLQAAPRLPLLDPDGGAAASAAIGRALTLKDAARQALWSSTRDDLAEGRLDSVASHARDDVAASGEWPGSSGAPAGRRPEPARPPRPPAGRKPARELNRGFIVP